MKEQQKDIFEIRNNLNKNTNKKEKLQHETDTIKNKIINKKKMNKLVGAYESSSGDSDSDQV